MRHFYLDTGGSPTPKTGDVVSLDREESHHLSTVLRGGREQEVVLTDGRGHRFASKVASRGRRDVSLEILTVDRDAEEFLGPRLVLALALIKPKRFEWALEKAVELGAHRIIPVISEHVDREARSGKQRRWRTIMVSAIKQCGRSLLPALDEPTSLKDLLGGLPPGLTVFGAIPEEMGPEVQPRRLTSFATGPAPDAPENLTALIGPQGGWTPDEVQGFVAAGIQPITLGPHILRAETAAASVLTGLQDLRRRWLDEAVEGP